MLSCIWALYYSSHPRLSKKLSVNDGKTVPSFRTGPRKPDTSPDHPKGIAGYSATGRMAMRNGAAFSCFPFFRARNLLSKSRFSEADYFPEPGAPSTLNLSHFPQYSEIYGIPFHREKEKRSLAYSELHPFISFSCKACRVPDDVSLCRESRFCCPCRRCGQSDWGCLLLNIRLPVSIPALCHNYPEMRRRAVS